jgi:hypothetical protein
VEAGEYSDVFLRSPDPSLGVIHVQGLHALHIFFA